MSKNFLFVFAIKQKGKNKLWAETEDTLNRSGEKKREGRRKKVVLLLQNVRKCPPSLISNII